MRFGNPIIPTEEMRAILKLCVDWYDAEPCGGNLHIVLDDDNVNDRCIEFCKKSMKDDGDPRIEQGNEILDRLLKLTEQQRMWVTMNIWNMVAGHGEREILEEFDDEDDFSENRIGTKL